MKQIRFCKTFSTPSPLRYRKQTHKNFPYKLTSKEKVPILRILLPDQTLSPRYTCYVHNIFLL